MEQEGFFWMVLKTFYDVPSTVLASSTHFPFFVPTLNQNVKASATVGSATPDVANAIHLPLRHFIIAEFHSFATNSSGDG
mmetsp:Transcript_28167/g.65475  ORF Transcript_28167/g.65475 Transcript_28167/m.65475 type:complete len:80 (+) Transcript_28167:76-315(+)